MKYSEGARLRISALCRIEPGFEEGYAKVADMYPDVAVIREESFSEQVMHARSRVHFTIPLCRSSSDKMFLRS